MDVKQLTVNAVRVLSVDAIDRANSGHPGLPLGASPAACELYFDFLKFNPKNPDFFDRDRFVLSAGHGSAMLYSLLYLFGYNVSIDDLKSFRQKGSICSGHPEKGVFPGVEITTGPLGQGIANAVGMAIAEKHLAAHYNKEDFDIVDHYTYALCGDGCMQEGIESEAASLAGTLKLNKLIVLYDKNNITIEGSTDLAFTEDVGARHKAQGWNVIYVADGNDMAQIKKAISKAKKQTEKPSLIICRTHIGYGSPLQDSAKVHGSPLGEANNAKLRENLGWTLPPFEIPDELKKQMKKYARKGAKIEKDWNTIFAAYTEKYPELAKELTDALNENYNLDGFAKSLEFTKSEATRSTGSTVLNKLADYIPSLFGGSADLGPSNKTVMKNREYFSAETPDGSNVHFGIREHAMAAACNGIAAHGGLLPYCSTFFVFSDYMKNAVRLSALMKLRVIYIFTHDSIGVGEDGPTHQPIEQFVGLRSIPGLNVIRPADGKETVYAYLAAAKFDGPTAIILSRQNLPQYGGSNENALKGGYVISDCDSDKPDCILIATGSEVEICVKAQQLLKEEHGVSARVVSMPSTDIFETQSEEYKNSILPSDVKTRVCVEAGSSMCWYKYAGDNGKIIAIDKFGESGKAEVLFEDYGFTAENVCAKAIDSLKK